MPGMTKAIIDFSGYTGDALLPAAQTTHDELNTNVATFPEPPPTLADLTTLIQNYGEALAKKASRARADFIAFGDNGAYVNIVAKGDPMIVSKSGYPSYEPKFSPDYSAPGAPANVVLRQGTVSSSMVCRFNRSGAACRTRLGRARVIPTWKLTGRGPAFSIAAKRR